jgi:hypothetical protein
MGLEYIIGFGEPQVKKRKKSKRLLPESNLLLCVFGAIIMRIRSLVVGLMFLCVLLNISVNTLNSSSDPVPLDTEQVSFSNVTYQAGLQNVGGQFLAWGDYNNDGYQDLLVNGARLFENNGPSAWDFTEVTSQVGISGGSFGTWADWNNDGFLDFFCAGSDKLYKNNGPPDYDFTDVTSSSGILKESHSTGCGWGDYDNDGDVDLFKIRGEDGGTGEYFPNSFWRNEGDGTFTNVTVEAGVDEYSDPKYSRGVTWADYNEDGFLDVYISNYRQLDNYLYENNRDGTFTDVAPQKGVADGPPYGEGGNLDPYDRGGHSVGSIWGDYDNDGYLDLWVTNLNHKDARTSDDSLLYHNDGPPDYTFTNMRDVSGIPVKPYVVPSDGDELFVGCAWGDYDNDGDLDLYLPQIYDIDYAYSFLYKNNGDGSFTDVTLEADVRVWDTYAGCWADYDNDGDLDLLTSGRDSGGNGDPHFVHLFRNDGTSGNWLQLDLRGDGENTNSAAVGTRVIVRTKDFQAQQKIVEAGMGPHGMQNSLVLDFGFGEYSDTVDIEIHWNNDVVQYLGEIQINQRLTINEPKSDLEATRIHFYDNDPIEGEVLDFYALIDNIGDIKVNYAEARIYVGPPSSNIIIGDASNITDFYPGGGWVTDRSWNTTGYTGYVTIYVVVENVSPSEEIVSNNIFSAEIYIREFNEPPVASFSVSNENPGIGEDVTFNATLSSDDTDIFYYHFDFGDGDSITSYGPVVKHEYSSGGTYTATLVVEDEDWTESTNFAEAVITVEAKPHAVLSASPKSIYEGASVTFDGSDSYEEGGVVEYYNFDFGDGQKSGWIFGSSITHTYNSAGSYSATLKVKDDDADESENYVYVIITVLEKPNSPPTAAIMYIQPNPVTQGRDVTFFGSGYDEDGEIEAYQWNSDLDGLLSDSQDFSTSVLSVGTHTISLSVQDDDSAWSDEVTETLLVKETNELPTVTITSPSDLQRISGTLNIQGSADDPDGDVVWVEIRIDGSQWIFALGTTSWSFGLDTTFYPEGEHILKARAFDGEDYSEEAVITIVVDNEVDDSEKDEQGNQLWILILIFIIVIVVVVAIIAVGMSGKKKGPAQFPVQEVEPIEEQSGTRLNW